MSLVKPILIFGFLILLASCRQDEVIIPGNIAPPDPTVEEFVIETYVNKVYISLLGREPNQTEFDQNFSALLSSNFDMNSRELLITDLVNRNEHLEKLFESSRVEVLNNLDTSEAAYWIGLYKFYLSDPGQMSSWPYYQYELDRLVLFRHALADLIDKQISVSEFYRRFADTQFYDEINMGSENFVVSLFQNFLDRYPTDSELERGVLMVDGFNSDLFFEIGSSKSDLLQIFFTSSDYYAGRVNYLFKKYLYRDAESEELEYYTKIYKDSDSYSMLQIAVFSSDEYGGLE